MTVPTPMQPALRFFRNEELEPGRARLVDHPAPLPLDPADDAQLEEFCRVFSQTGKYFLDDALSQKATSLNMFVRMLAVMGVVHVSRSGNSVEVRQGGRLARHVPMILKVYLDRSYRFIDDWNRSSILQEDRLNAVAVVHLLELRRIELDRMSGRFPETFAERPVAFGVFRALDQRGRSCYLFEVNKDWQRLNFIGGKQEAEDGGDFHATLRREISEELGIARSRVTLTRLNEDPIVGYSLSGNVGSLARYPCVLFGVIVEGEVVTRPRDQWIHEDTIRRYMDLPDCPVMVNPEYMRFLLSGDPSRLERCPLTTTTVVASSETDHSPIKQKARVGVRMASYARDNKELLAAILTLVAALITVILAF